VRAAETGGFTANGENIYFMADDDAGFDMPLAPWQTGTDMNLCENSPHPFDVLLVEDNPYDAELMLRALRKDGLANGVVWLKDGAAVLDFLFGTAGDAAAPSGTSLRLVLLDLKLSEVDGLEVLRRIKSDQRTRTIPVVVLTSSLDESDLLHSYDAGVNSYIVKPVDFDRFTQAVRQLGLYWLVANQPPNRRILVTEETA
jgi:CheY-like chemotaxis protein